MTIPQAVPTNDASAANPDYDITGPFIPQGNYDIAIVIDTTGSMQNQIDRLKSTLQSIHYLLTQLPSKPDIRFGLVAYRDRSQTEMRNIGILHVQGGTPRVLNEDGWRINGCPVNGPRLDARFVRETGAVDDWFQVVKRP